MEHSILIPPMSKYSEKEPTIGIITALPKEYSAVRKILENTEEISFSGQGAGRRYLLGKVFKNNEEKHTVVLCFSGMGSNIAAIRASFLINYFPNLKSIIMVGIAGGIPHPEKTDDHVRLGDIVISNEKGVIQYDFDKETITENIHRYPPRPPSASLIEGVRLLEADELMGKKPWLDFIDQALLPEGEQRPSIETDVLVSSTDSNQIVEHPQDSKRKNDEPRVFIAPIASANKLLKNPIKRNQLRDKFGVKAVEMEGSGIADATWSYEIGYLVVRGICDYCDSKKGDNWQAYAAAVGAAYTRALLESIPSPKVIDPQLGETETGGQKIDWGDAPDLNIFFGRETQLINLKDLIINQGYRLIVLRGTLGIGKTFLGIKLGQEIQDKFDYVVWRNLESNLPIGDFLDDIIKFISRNKENNFPNNFNVKEKVSRLIKYLKEYRCLLILDNWETVIYHNSSEDYQTGYGHFLKQIINLKHRSCLIVTSCRELKEAEEIYGKNEPVFGLGKSAVIQTLIKRGLNLDNVEDEVIKHILDTYKGNPSMLKFIAYDSVLSGDLNRIRDFSTQNSDKVEEFLLDQFEQLSETELSIIYWLAIEGKPITFKKLKDNFDFLNDGDLRRGIKNLSSRSLIEAENSQWWLDPIFRKLTLHQFIEHVQKEFEEILESQTKEELIEILKSDKINFLRSHTLIKDNYQDLKLENAQKRRILKYLKNKLNSDRKFLSIDIKEKLTTILSWLSSLQEDSVPQKMIGYTIVNIQLIIKDKS